MSTGLAFLISELTKMGIQLAMQQGSLDTLTEEQAQAVIAQLAAKLDTTLPTPEELENAPPA